jgi:diadenosine tetraphosphate (Ap4A) HIT family hydrolase
MGTSNFAISQPACEFCAEIETGTIHGAAGEQAPIEERFVSRTSRFIAFPSVSPLRLGHLLIVPNEHVTAASHLEPDARQELIDFSKRMGEAISPAGDVACFEHGVGREQAGGCGIDHAHLHLLPMTSEERSLALEAIREDFATEPPVGLGEVLDSRPIHTSYLYFGTFDSVHSADAAHIPSQFLRRCAARSIGNPIEDWRSLADWGVLQATHAELVS